MSLVHGSCIEVSATCVSSLNCNAKRCCLFCLNSSGVAKLQMLGVGKRRLDRDKERKQSLSPFCFAVLAVNASAQALLEPTRVFQSKRRAKNCGPMFAHAYHVSDFANQKMLSFLSAAHYKMLHCSTHGKNAKPPHPTLGQLDGSGRKTLLSNIGTGNQI